MLTNSKNFAVVPPKLDIQRSRFKIPFNHKTSCNFGDIVPVLCMEVLPGDTFVGEHSFLARMTTPVHPVMDNSWIDLYYFFVPNRLLWDHWKEFMGENTDSYWTPKVEYVEPTITAPESAEIGGYDGFYQKSIMDYLGVPPDVPKLTVSALPSRGYTLIYNEWFRSEALQDEHYLYKGDNDQSASASNYLDPVAYGYLGNVPLFKACKSFDYFTGCLPAPQRGPSVTIPLASSAPVGIPANGVPMVYGQYNPITETTVYGTINSDENGALYFNNDNAINAPLFFGDVGHQISIGSGIGAAADTSSLGGTISELRMAFQLQRLLEADARSGGRYVEQIKAHFGVTSPDFRLQRSEYIGGHRYYINVQQVLQTSATDDVSPQGNTAAYSLTADSGHAFTYSATEHGFIYGIAVPRYQHTYQQGIERMFFRRTRFDYYFPEFAAISERAVFNKELYATGDPQFDDGVFGYQEAWAEYRYKPNRVSGQFRSANSAPLDSWHYADDYGDTPYLSSEWITEDPSNVDRTLAVSSANADQIILDYLLDVDAVRPLPLYSIPGMVDHF